MTTSLIDADSLLVIDIGSISTRAMLFDLVDGNFRFLASGSVPTTAGAPFHNVSEGVRMAIDKLQKISGRNLVGSDEELIIPSTSDGSGVDKFAATISAGAPLKVIPVGLLGDVSLESAKRLTISTYTKVIHTFSLDDRRRSDTRLDAILKLRPDLVIVAGGTENGASQSVIRMLEPVGLACYLMPEGQRPEILFVGNTAIRDEVMSSLEGLVKLHFAPNIRPTLEEEQLDAAQARMAQIYTHIRANKLSGVSELIDWSSGGVVPTATAFGRIIRFLSKTNTVEKGVLGIDVGSSATTIAAAYDGDLSLSVFPHFGLGSGLAAILKHVSLEDITRWLPEDVSDEDVREYLFNKTLYPASLPVTIEDMAIEQAITRQIMQSAIQSAANGFPGKEFSVGEDFLPWVEPIVATGSVLTKAPSLADSVLMLLDGLQPTGVTTIVLDQNQIASALGAAAAVNPVLTVQILDSNSFLHVGTVISPVGGARSGTPVLRVTMTYESGHETKLEVKQGMLEVLPLPQGQSARLQLQPLQRYDVGMGASGRGGVLNVMGGALGIIIDARGRPLKLPADRGKVRDLVQKWRLKLGGQ